VMEHCIKVLLKIQSNTKTDSCTSEEQTMLNRTSSGS
jgi:hypothetical protein